MLLVSHNKTVLKSFNEVIWGIAICDGNFDGKYFGGCVSGERDGLHAHQWVGDDV
jgi:hypothetical protein